MGSAIRDPGPDRSTGRIGTLLAQAHLLPWLGLGRHVAGGGGPERRAASAGDEPTAPRRELLLLIVGTIASGLALSLGALPGLLRLDPSAVLLLLAVVLIGEFWSLDLYARSTFSVTAAARLAGALLLGMPGVALTAWLAALIRGWRRRSRWHKVLFNGSVYTLGGGLAVLVFSPLKRPLQQEELPILLVTSVIAGAGYYLHTIPIALAMGLERGENPYQVWATNFRWLFPYYIVLAVLAALLALAFVEYGIVGAVVFLVPVLMMRYVAGAYVRQTVEHVNRLQRVNQELEQTAAELGRRNAQVQLLSAAGHLLASSARPEAELPAALAMVAGKVGEGCGVYLQPRDAGDPIVAVAHRVHAHDPALHRLLARLQPAMERQMAVGETLVAPVAALDPDPLCRALAVETGVRSLIGAPMRADLTAIGSFVCFFAQAPEAIQETERLLVAEIAERLANVLERSRLIEEAARVEALRELNRAKSELISVVSHELRTPMTSVRGLSEILLHQRLDGEDRQELLRIIHQESVRVSDLLDDLLDISRIEAGRLDLELAPVDLGAAVEATLMAVRPHSPQHAFRAAYPAGLPPALADREKLRRILDNLIGNAVKYSPDGGEIVVGVGVVAGGACLEVRVTDPGVGIAPEDLARIFERFERATAARTRGTRGAGLGLYIAKNLVEMHGGRIWAESIPGQGSTFAFTLPAAAPPA